MKFLAVVLSVSALSSAAPVAAQDANFAPADRADLQCMALVAVMTGMSMEEGVEGEDATRLAGLASGMMYYLGRLEGRSPDTDWLAELGLFLDKTELADLDAVSPRCGKELMAKSQALVAFGAKSSPGTAE